jgi:hypothetical protein
MKSSPVAHRPLLVLLFILLHYYFILFTFNTLCLTTTRWSWGHKTRNLFCTTRRNRAFSMVPQEFDIYSESSLSGYYSFYNTLHLES